MPRGPRFPAAPVVALVVGSLAAALLPGCTRSEAQEENAALFISGMRIGGGSRAVVRLRNVAPGSTVYFVHYTIRATDAGQPLSLPAAGPQGAPLIAGDTLELDLGGIVNAYRRSLGAGSYSGTVQFVAFAEGGGGHPFGPETVAVDATQAEGSARFQANVAWR